MVMPSTAITRYDLSKPFSEFDLRLNQLGFIGPQVFRPRTVDIQAADVGKTVIEQLLQQKSTKRAAGAGYKRGDFEFTKYNYATEEYGWEEPLDDRTLRIFADMIEAEQIHADRAMDFVLGEYERDCATTLYDTAVWTGAALTSVITDEWDDHANAIPIDNIIAGREKVLAGCGMMPNALILNDFQFRHLCQCNQIKESVKYTNVATSDALASYVAEILGIERIIIAGKKGAAVKNSAINATAASISRIWSNEYMMLAKVAVTDDPQEPCVGRTFVWSGDGPSAAGSDEALALIVEEYREENKRGGVIRARNDRQILVMYPEAAHMFSNAIT